MKQIRITDDLNALMTVLPQHIIGALEKANNSDNLLEIILDLGRPPVARFVDHELRLDEQDTKRDDIDHVVSRIGDFDADNRAGLERTLHRISAIRNRHGVIVGLTCRVGRAVYGTIEIIQDLVESGKSILLLGKPGIGKTTMLRESARILAESKRVIIVDTSNEIGGDGDVPHPAVGKARRMQVSTPSLQHEVMIEAVENHNPEVVIIDEIGRELEAMAARTIAERGVQLVATAHGRTLENLLLNPTLSDLVGGIESVTLSDEEARRRGTQKTVLERRSPPTFDMLVELQERDRLAVHQDVAAAVDTLVRGYPLQPEIRWRDAANEVHVEKAPQPAAARVMAQGTRRTYSASGEEKSEPGSRHAESRYLRNASAPSLAYEQAVDLSERRPINKIRIYPYGVARNRLQQAAHRLGVPALIARDVSEADIVMTLRAYYRSRQQPITEAESRGIPIYVLRANTINQMEQSLAEIFNLSEGNNQNLNEVTNQTESAIQAVLNGQRWVDLPPASSSIRRIQHEMARQAQLVSHSYGKDPNRRVRIFRE
ncbi:MAG TPA: R3H domain-containing nucleic acid-binding protein [Anaerolineaceae bacterium]|jgi:stage III sporulation protein SpoIIIAA|nr:R3H domain-containing nucleic acid-binding protein [Anaerolineaceae bacterium]HQM53885.1 R3H domain-containing nucleic acid-binding protein [Anaerolineaceae bacterium]